jgi:hypothetical protein
MLEQQRGRARRGFLVGVVAAVVCAAGGGCSAIIGLSDVPAPEADGGGFADATTEGGAGGDGGDATAPGRDATGAESGAESGGDGPAAGEAGDALPGEDGPVDAGPVPDGGAVDGETGPVGDAGDGAAACDPTKVCTPAPCQVGQVQCDGGVGESSCMTIGSATDGTACGDGGVCHSGACSQCSAGADCSEAGSCQRATISCAGGTAACTAAGNQPNGSSCGSNLYCNNGACAPCTNGAPCTPSGNPCHVGTTACMGGASVCTDTMSKAPDGTSCGTNMVCSGGSCVACTAGAACTPGGNVCQTGATSCATGTSVCMSTGNATAGTPCDDGKKCTTNDKCGGGSCAGTAVTCTASDQCHQAGSCDTSSGACSNPLQPAGHACDDGNACTTGDQCNASGVCGGTQKTCTASDQCHQAGTCSGGVCSNPLQSAGHACDDGDGCTTNDQCNASGTCAGTAITCTAQNECQTAGSCSGGMCNNPAKTDGTACMGDGEHACKGGQCQCDTAHYWYQCGATSQYCTSITNDSMNCGMCGRQCTNGYSCDPNTPGFPQGSCEYETGASGSTTGSLQAAANTAYAMQATVPLNSIAYAMYFTASTFTGFSSQVSFSWTLYTNSGGHPGTPIGSFTQSGAFTCYNCGEDVDISINAGTYWMVLAGNWDANNYPKLATRSGGTCLSAATSGGALPNPWPASSSGCTPLDFTLFVGGD